MWKHIGSMRYVFNWGLDKQIKHYETTKKKLSVAELGVELTKLKNQKEFEWLYDISHATLKEALRDLDKAYKNFFNGSGFPKFKGKKKSKDKFYSRYDKIYFKENIVNFEKIGKVQYRHNYDIDLSKVSKFSNPRVSFNGRI